MSSTQLHVVLFGATANSGGLILREALTSGYQVTALCRTPSKLADLAAAYPTLKVVPGDVKNLEDVKRTLRGGSEDPANGNYPDVVISTVGATWLSFWPNPFRPRMPDPSICAGAIENIATALAEFESIKKPIVVTLSSTGITSKGRDIPIAMIPLYNWLLVEPHRDKRDMENYLYGPKGQNIDWVIIRPSWLTDGEKLGPKVVRVGVEEEDKLQIGYTISRRDVAGWIFDEIIKNPDRKRWAKKSVTITY